MRDDDGLRIHGSKSNSFELLLTLLTGFPKDFCVTKLWKNFQNKSLQICSVAEMDATYLFCEMPNTRRHFPYIYLLQLNWNHARKLPISAKSKAFAVISFLRVPTRFFDVIGNSPRNFPFACREETRKYARKIFLP